MLIRTDCGIDDVRVNFFFSISGDSFISSRGERVFDGSFISSRGERVPYYQFYGILTAYFD